MSSSELYDLIIVGGGPAGLSAGIYAMRAALKTVLVELGVHGGQMAMSDEVENYPGFIHISGAELSMKFSEHAQSYGLETLSEEVTAVEPGLDYHTVRLGDGRELKTLSVIIATGGSPRKLGVPGENEYYGKGVSYCAVCDGFFFRGKTVVVVGGGDSAVEESLYLSKIVKKVYLVHRRDSLRAGMILQKRLMKEPNVEIVWDTVLNEIKADEGGVNAVLMENLKTGEQRLLDTDGVFIFIGFNPNNSLVPAGTKMNADGYVVTDDTCATQDPGVYVVGDLREKYARQIVVSASDGCIAALAAAHHVEIRKASSNFADVEMRAGMAN